MSEMRDLLLVMGIIIAAVFLFIFVTFGIMLWRKRDSQPIKSRSPKLLLASLFGNVLSTIALCFSIAAGGKLEKSTNEVAAKLAVNIGVIASEVIAYPCMSIPYMLRVRQFMEILNIKEAQLKNEDQPNKSNIAVQRNYIKQWCFASAVFFFVGLSLIVPYIIIAKDTKSDDQLWKSVDSIVTMIVMFMGYVSPCILCICGLWLFKLTPLEINMNSEILTTAAFWVVCSAGFFFMKIFLQGAALSDVFNSMAQEIAVLVISITAFLARNVFTFIISIILPIIKSQEGYMIPYGENRECVNSVEIALSTELPYVFFSDFIDKRYGEDGTRVLTLYAQIKLFEDSMDCGSDEEEVIGIADSIIADIEEQEGWPGFDKGQINKLKELKGGPPRQDIFADLYNAVFKQLQDYFEQFKKSLLFKSLCRELRKNEIIFERLAQVELI